MVIVQLTSSTFWGGPERQMLGLAQDLLPDYQTMFMSFSEGGRCQRFLEQTRAAGFEALQLRHDTPYLGAAVRELTGGLARLRADVLCCHGYKADLLGRLAARRARIPVVAIARGWTGENLKVRLYEAADRLALRWMDRVVCVSAGQADRVRRAGVPAGRVVVIRNAIRPARFATPQPEYRQTLHDYFAGPRRRIVGAAGRLSPEKGFAVLVEAATQVARTDPEVGFILFGEGALRQDLVRQVAAAGLSDKFVLAGFRDDLDRFLPFLDLLVQSSFTEGLPNVLLEAFAAGVPVVATAVGGTPELVDDGVSGFLVPAGDPAALASRIHQVLASEQERQEMGRRGRDRVVREFSFAAQGQQYKMLFQSLLAAQQGRGPRNGRGGGRNTSHALRALRQRRNTC
jgi:glycosyltransferase involved in cell wall biosynthesis